MIIPKNLSKFKDKNIILFVCGKKNMLVYEAKKNNIKKLIELNVELPKYSDNEGHFKVRSGGKVMRSGSVREVDSQEIILKFAKKIKGEMKSFDFLSYDLIYLFCPIYSKNYITEALPVKIQKKLNSIIEGNYHTKSPIFLLEKISKLEIKSKMFLKPEAQKIMQKSKKARRVIKGK